MTEQQLETVQRRIREIARDLEDAHDNMYESYLRSRMREAYEDLYRLAREMGE